jgi:hypothetical protein
VCGALEARPIGVSKQKKVRRRLSWTFSRALQTITALDLQWLERVPEMVLGITRKSHTVLPILNLTQETCSPRTRCLLLPGLAIKASRVSPGSAREPDSPEADRNLTAPESRAGRTGDPPD